MLTRIYAAFICILLSLSSLEGTPSSIFWTVCTTDVYDTGIGHIDEDNYFTVFYDHGKAEAFPPDTGFEAGIFTIGKFKAEGGFDYLGGTDNPFYFNFGIGTDDLKICSKKFSFKVGIFNAGTRSGGSERTNQNIVDVIIGKELPEKIGGRFFLGGFTGSRAMGKNRQGFMIAYQKQFCPAKDCDDNKYYKWAFCADYASGKNTIGGGGVGLVYNFTPNIDIITGPVWFNSKKINGSPKWSVQIDISFQLFKPKMPSK